MMIEEVLFYTVKLKELHYFYGETLGMRVSSIDASDGFFTVQAGITKMIFKQWNDTFEAESKGIEPFYHFAWMIPRNQFQEAKQWAASRVTLSTDGERDEAYSHNWNSHSLYFEDPAGNIVELIAHHQEHNEQERAFSVANILQVCEIGLVSENVPTAVKELEKVGLVRWGEGSDTFSPVGDRRGLFIVVKKERIWFFSNQKAQIYPLEATIREIGKLQFKPDNSESSGYSVIHVSL
ncbi:MAG: ring-cleaving dioxygenase [Paenibacillus sp.]|uniref:VOC family protein n=1 Tax=Paenibacillus sp. TaxID=58172 RepID=UPI0025DE7D7D|nr:ring-cleaving dioxygenase [Paenibacillus sp.]MBR2567197.1 ring-cleaving dioxygenase [Paenibacillus sp.]